MKEVRICSFLLTAALAACQQGVNRKAGGDQPLIAVTAPAETSDAALTFGEFALAGRCLVFRTTDGRTYLPVFGRPVTIASDGAPARALPEGGVVSLGQIYSVGGAPFPEGRAPDGLAEDVASQCRYPAFAIGAMRKGAAAPPPAPPS